MSQVHQVLEGGPLGQGTVRQKESWLCKITQGVWELLVPHTQSKNIV